MEVELVRSYNPLGVNGVLFFKGSEICKTVELPWLENRPRVSCIPEGTYRLRKRYTPRFSSHFEIMGVPARKYILFHVANDAAKELRGCIAPVLRHTAPGKGTSSRAALDQMKKCLFPLLDKGAVIFLTVKNANK